MASTLSTRAIAKVLAIVVALGLAVYLVTLVQGTLELCLISIFVAIALGPAVDLFDRRYVPRWLAVLLVFALIGAAIVGMGLLVVPPIVEQVEDLAANAPSYIEDLQRDPTVQQYDREYGITQKLQDQAEQLPERLGDAAGTLEAVTVGVFSAGTQLFIVLTIAFFLLLDGRRITDGGFRLLGPRRARRLRPIAHDIYRAVGGYVLGAFLIALIAFTVTLITLTILDVPFAIPLALLMAFFDLVPLVGATIGGVIIGLVTLVTDFPTATIVWVVVLIVYQQVENQLIQPLVYKRTVQVAPLIVIIAILIGGTLLGVLGALLAIPAAAAIQIVVRDVRRARRAAVALEEPAGHAGRADAPDTS